MELDIIKNSTTWNDASASINNNFAKVKTALEQGGGTGGGVDTQMSDTSEKAVQNKVIKKYVDDEVEDAKAYSEEMADNAEKAAKQYTDNKVESVSPLYVNIGMDFPNETATGTLPDLEISFSDILSAAEGKRDIWIVVSDGTAYQCLVTYLSESSGGIVIRAYKHEVNGANFSTIAIAFVDGSVPIWHSNYIEFQEKLVSGQNIATVNGQSLLEGGNIVIKGGGGSDVDIFPSEYSDEFNDDFTN